MNETKTVFKVFLVYDFEKEERWLNEMALSGWALKSVGFCIYTFERCEPGEYFIRLEMHNHDDAYLSFMAETGAEYIGRIVKWIYFRRKADLGYFDIFSDTDSRIAHLNKISSLLKAVGLLNLAIGIMNSFNSHISWAGALNLLCATLLMYCLGRIQGKKEEMLSERRLHE